MAEKKRKSGTQLEEAIHTEPYHWNFFALIRELEKFFTQKDRDLGRTGFSYKIKNDALRFRQTPSLAFPPSDIAGYRPATNTLPAELMIHCFGLLGCNGPMPLYLTEYIFQRVNHHKDPALKDFFDIFHHRMISLYYRAWAINQITVSKDWEEDPFSVYVGSLINYGNQSYSELDDIPNDARLFYSGRLIQKSINAEGLCAILSDYFNIPVRLNQFTGQWIQIPEQDQFRVGESEDTGLLGRTCILGSRIWDINQKFKLILGPMKLSLYERLVPGSRGFKHLKEWIDNYVGMSFDWDVQLILEAAEIPDFSIDKKIQLGFTSWFKKREGQEDVDDLTISGNR